MSRRVTLSLLAGALLLGACRDLTVPDYNNPSIEELESTPTRTGVNAAATGLLVVARNNIASPNAYISLLGIIGRESYNFDPGEPRFITEMLGGPMSPSGAFGGNVWAVRYRNVRNANIVLSAVEKVAGFSEAEKEAIRGFAKTIQALDFLLIINTRDTNGAPIDVSHSLNELNDNPAKIESKAVVVQHILTLLDQADAHLQRGGGAFPFPLSSGFEGFSTPAEFRQFNRALRARVAVYAGSYAQALTALQGSFLSTAAPLSRGVYYSYATGSGETQNNLVAATIRAHPSITADAERRADGSLDRRAAEKVVVVAPRSQAGLSSDLGFAIYSSNSSPAPVIRNEELILLRAEARWFTGDRSGAMADLNLIRQSSGGLAAVGEPASDAAFVTELLRQRRYSLLFEGHRWIDLRRFNRLAELPKDLAGHLVHTKFPIPEAECLARKLSGECGAS